MKYLTAIRQYTTTNHNPKWDIDPKKQFYKSLTERLV